MSIFSKLFKKKAVEPKPEADGRVLKFKIGQKVRVVDDFYAPVSPHGRNIGEVYTIVEAVRESRMGAWAQDYQEYRLEGDPSDGWVREEEIEEV